MMPPNREQPNWQGIWEGLHKLGIEPTEDRRNGIVQAYERIVDPLSIGWRPLIERYTEGNLGIHVHMHQGMPSTPYLLGAPDLCATFERPRSVFLKDSEFEFFATAPNVAESHMEKSEMKVAVLVDVPEFFENRERLSGRILPVVKRLQRLEVCAETWPDSPEALRLLGGGPGDEVSQVIRGVGINVNRETDASPLTPRPALGNRVRRGRVPRLDGELPNEVVERGTEVVNDIPNDGAQLVHGRLSKHVTVDDYLSGLLVRIVGNSVETIIDERMDPFFEDVHVHISPVNLGPTTVQRVTHDER